MKKLYSLLLAFSLFTAANAQIVNIPDANFKAKLLEANPTNRIARNLSGSGLFFKIDANDDGEIQESEALNVKYLDVITIDFSTNISDLTGIEYFLNLTSLNCSSNELSSLPISSLVNLTFLSCANNKLNSLDVSSLVNLKSLICNMNNLSSLDISKTKVESLSCEYNKLKSLFIKSGYNYYRLAVNFSNNPDLSYICCNELQLVDIQNKVTSLDYTNCVVNSYCSFTPGGTFYTIQGSQKLDSNNNGCDANDFTIPNLKYTITSGTITCLVLA